jgi:hypothetical protein
MTPRTPLRSLPVRLGCASNSHPCRGLSAAALIQDNNAFSLLKTPRWPSPPQ